MKQNVWIINHYASGMLFDKGGRHYNIAKWLKQAGYEPVVFCANSKHNASGVYFENNALWHAHTAEEIDTPFVFVRARAYEGSGKQRILNMVDFYRNVKKTAKEYARQHCKPDMICASSVHPLTLVAGIRLAKCFGVKCICEIRDLWPESIVAYGIAGPKNPIVVALRMLERWIYKNADAVVFTMEGAYDYIIEQGWEKDIPRSKVHYINNGVDLDLFHYNREHYQIHDEDLEDPDTFKVVYTGSIRKVNNLGLLLDAAKQVTAPHVKFLIWGDGDELPALKQRLTDENIQNVVFKGKVEKKYVPYIVSLADWNFMHGTANALFRFGISPNKMFDYFAAERPLLMDIQAKYNPVVEFNCGLCGENREEILRNIQNAIEMPKEQYQQMCRNAARAAEEFDFKRLTQKLERIIKGGDMT